MIYCNATDCTHNNSTTYGTICKLKNICINCLVCSNYQRNNNVIPFPSEYARNSQIPNYKQ